MALEQMKVREIVKQAVGKSVDIPEFQREFVWDPEQVKLLAESLYRDYPVGSFLLWDSSEYQEAKTAQGTQASLWIVDGQQRTTALCLLIGQKPYWWGEPATWNKAMERYDVMANILPSDGERLEFGLPNPIRRKDPRWVSIRKILALEEVGALTQLAGETVQQVEGNSGRMMERFAQVHARLQQLWQIRERDIPIVKITHEVEDVAEIFARLNQAGTRVKEADVILALAAVRNPGWVRDHYLPYRSDLEDRGWDLDAGVFIRTMTAIGYGRARLAEVPKDFWSPANLPSVWSQTREMISEVLKRLAEFGIMSPDLLPSTNSLIPLITLHSRWSEKAGYSFPRALHWFLLANRDGRYSGSATTTLNEDVRGITESPDFDGAIRNLEKRLRISSEVGADEFINHYNRAGNRFLRLMCYLVLFHQNASDWVDGSRIGYDRTGTPMTQGFEPQWHHIYPRSVLRRAGKKDDDIHVLANITVLNEKTNVNKLAGKEPWRYIQQFRLRPEALREHLIPAPFIEAIGDPAGIKERWGIDRYEEFVLQRAELLATEANRFLHQLSLTPDGAADA